MSRTKSKKQEGTGKKIFRILKEKKLWILVLILLALHIFLRFYQLEYRMVFNYDQVDSAWAAKNIIDDHKFPLFGPANKLGSGIFVGPGYYYLISVFYFFTQLDPIAAGIFAGVLSVLTFFVIFFIGKGLFGVLTALFALAINIVSFSGVEFDRIQWEINFVPLVSLVVFYSLYKICRGDVKFIFLLAFALGFSFHVHFTTAVYLPILVLLAFPFFPLSKKLLKKLLFALPIFLVFIMPILLANIQSKNSLFSNSAGYIGASFHGLYLTRVLQLTHVAFIQIASFFTFPQLGRLSIVILPIFGLVYLFKKLSRDRIILVYLVAIWFLVPWLIMSVYNGEITPYYLSVNRYVALLILAYLLVSLLSLRKFYISLLLFLFFFYYSYINLQNFFAFRTVGLLNYKLLVKKAIEDGKEIKFKEGDPRSYLYYFYTRKR